MDIKVIKQVISELIPNHVNISDIDINELGCGLTIKLTWEALKAKEKCVNVYAPSLFSSLDGYIGYDLDSYLSPFKEMYHKKLQNEIPSEFETYKKANEKAEEVKPEKGPFVRPQTKLQRIWSSVRGHVKAIKEEILYG